MKPKKASVKTILILLMCLCVEVFLKTGLDENTSSNLKLVDFGPLSLNTVTLWIFVISVILILLATVFRIYFVPRLKDRPGGVQTFVEVLVTKLGTNAATRFKKVVILLTAWAAFGVLITLIFGSPSEGHFDVEIFAPIVKIGQITTSVCTVWGIGITLSLTLIAVIFRVFIFPKFKEKPAGVQNLLELSISKMEEYTHTSAHDAYGEGLSAYMFSLCIYLAGCASVELFGVRAPTSDILTTFSLAMVTFFLINYYGLSRKGFKGRVGDFVRPSPVMAPIKLITDLAIPVSMACRLFGNMLAGLIVMELIYFALGNFAAGPPAVAGIYFNMFHPLMQAFIFMTLSLSFIGEAAESPE